MIINMRTLQLAMLFIVSLTAWRAMAQEQQIIFKGDAGSTKYDGYSVTLFRYDMLDKDTSIEGKIKDGKFEIKAPYTGPGQYLFQNGYELKVKGGYKPYAILAEKAGTIQIKADMENLGKSTTSGSAPQSVKEEFEAAVAKKEKPFMDGLRKKYGAAMIDNPTEHVNEPKFNEMVAEWQNFQQIESPKINTAVLLEFAERYPKSMAIAKLANNGSVSLRDKEKVYTRLSADNKNNRYGKELGQMISVTKRSAIGTQIPDFSLPTADGKFMKLKDMLRGKKYLYIDFWASWCGPCRAEFPTLKALYAQFKDKGFGVWGISTDKSRDNWLWALKQEQPTWPQVWEGGTPKEQKASDNLFYVPYLPSTYLLDSDGRIVARDLRGEELTKKISELLAE